MQEVKTLNPKPRKQRQKLVFSSTQVCHVWAAQSQSEGRNSAKNIFFEGPNIYSYGHHYLMAKIYPDKNNAVLINEDSYSSTTSGHKSHVFGATKHLKSWCVSDPANPLKSIKDMGDELTYSLMNMLSSRVHYEKTCDSHFDDYNELCTLFDQSKERLFIPDDLREVINDYMSQQSTKNEARLLEKQAKRREENAARNLKLAPNLELWLKGESVSHWDMPDLELHKIRVKGDTVETTGGADVPLSHALRLLDLIDKKQASQGQRVGHFELDAYDSTTVTIGCHSIGIAQAREVLNPFKGGSNA